MVYFAMYRRTRSLSSSAVSPAHAFITWASCQVRRIVSPIRPIPCESLLTIEIAPSSCSGPSAAIVAGWIRSAAASTSLRHLGRSTVDGQDHLAGARPPSLGPYGIVGVVEEHTTLGSRTRPIRSGTWPPPAPSTW